MANIDNLAASKINTMEMTNQAWMPMFLVPLPNWVSGTASDITVGQLWPRGQRA